jgi:hypothetical protein
VRGALVLTYDGFRLTSVNNGQTRLNESLLAVSHRRLRSGDTIQRLEEIRLTDVNCLMDAFGIPID